jgi:hypothetical protein
MTSIYPYSDAIIWLKHIVQLINNKEIIVLITKTPQIW